MGANEAKDTTVTLENEAVDVTSAEFTETEESAAAEDVGTAQGNGGSDENGGAGADEDGAKESSAGAASKSAHNAMAAERRRRAEREVAISEARKQAILEVTGGENPYTHEKITDERDIEEYLIMNKIAREGGDPLLDFAKASKQQARAAETERRQENFFAQDRADFVQAFPDVDLEALIHDEGFAAYADGKVGKRPLSEIYRGYQKLIGGYQQKAEQKARGIAQRAMANKAASPGSLKGSGSRDHVYTIEEVKSMSPEEVHKNYDKIVRDTKYWK